MKHLGQALITGAAGFVGRNLTSYLRTLGWSVRPLDNLSIEPCGPIPWGLMHCDVLDLTSKDLLDIDIVVHLAAYKSVPNSFTSHNETMKNIQQDRHLLEVATGASVPKVILASSCEVYGRNDAFHKLCEHDKYNPMSPYAVSKVALEMHANIYRQLAHDTTFTCVRFFNIYGPDEGKDAVVPRFVEDILNSGILTIEGDGSQRRDFSYIDDMVKIISDLMLIKNLPLIINIGCGESHSVNDLASMLIEIAGAGTIRYKQERPNEIQGFCADTRLLKNLLGRDIVRTSLQEGLQNCIDEARSEIALDTSVTIPCDSITSNVSMCQVGNNVQD